VAPRTVRPDLSRSECYTSSCPLGCGFELEGDLENLQDFSMVLLLPTRRWVGSLLSSQQVLLGDGYCTALPVNTHSEVCLAPSDHAVFRSLRLSLRLDPTACLWMLEDWLTWAFPGAIVSCWFTTSGGHCVVLVHNLPS
jgi:hypothetical protein